MARVVVLGAGVAGHTAAAFLKKWLGRHDEIIVVSPQPKYNWIPSNIWVGVGLLKKEQVTFPLAPIYRRAGIEFKQARALALYPEGVPGNARPSVEIEYTAEGKAGQREHITYDFLLNATGPKLNFDATTGLGPGKNSLSVCTANHAEETSRIFLEKVERMKRGEKQRFLIGTGHGGCTCQGAAFEYVVNLEFELRNRGVRDKAEVIYLTNEYEIGDFGMDGVHIRSGGYVTPSKIFQESLFAERGIDWITRAHVREVEPGAANIETLDGEQRSVPFDMAMLLPPFTGVGLKAYNAAGEDISSSLFAPNGFMKVDADYTRKPYEEWKPRDWPRTYQNPSYSNLFAAGIAFAPPHAISRPRATGAGQIIAPAPPRTGMPSAMIAKAVAHSITDMVRGKPGPTHTASMAEMGAACVASAGANPFTGTAASITVFPIVPDYERYPEYGRDIDYTFGEIGLAGHWIKILLHHLFLYKARMLPGWALIPE
ncbi:FAD-dependent oxidoreductase [uncultured Paludibaculum sp.]|uniref:NAD(P)/FAD-dependent oxidoreductase n=1 Tax=uncultured Paludibaculum sp. TaxID=1765020 RepID=UPI002AAAA3B8|nr:FAD-dependent oxidoreductase [uncultured Paludibaculum sp.]